MDEQEKHFGIPVFWRQTTSPNLMKQLLISHDKTFISHSLDISIQQEDPSKPLSHLA